MKRTARSAQGRRTAALAVVAAALVGAGLWLAGDRPGLTASYYANTSSWRGDPVGSDTAEPRVAGPSDLRRVLSALEVFSLSWRGWLEIDRPGPYRFELDASEGAFLRLDGEPLVDLAGTGGEPRAAGETVLAAGLHLIEAGSVHTGRAPRLEISWSPPGTELRRLDLDRLYDRRPGTARRWLRRASRGIAPLGRRAVGAVLVVAGLVLAAAALRSRQEPAELRGDRREGGRRASGPILLVLLAAATYAILWRAAGSPLGGGDAYWLERAVTVDAAPGGTAAARAPHLLVLEAFLALTAGDPFAAGRAASAFLLTLAVVALAVAARGLQPARWRTLAVTGFVLFAQPFLFTDLGAALPELSAMAWVSVGLAICLHHPTAGRWRRLASACALGAVTAIAAGSHAGGLILLWPALLLLRHEGRWAPLRAAGRLGAWTAGLLFTRLAVAAVAAVTTAGAPAAGAGLDAAPPPPSAWRWAEVLWSSPAGSGGGGDLRPLALLVVGAALAAAVTGRTLERRLLHLTPLVFVAALTIRRLFVPAPPSPTDLLPIVPAACLLGGALFLYAGLESLSCRRLLTLPFVVPLAAAAVEVVLVAPYLSGRLAPHEILPWLSPVAAGDLLRRTAAPLAAVALVIAAALSLVRSRLRLPVLLAAGVLALGPGLAATARLLATRQPAQRAGLVLYPWHQLGGAIHTDRRHRIAVSPALVRDSAMFGPPAALETIGRLFFGEPALEIGSDRKAMRRAHYLIVAPAEVPERRTGVPAVARRVERDEAGRLALLRTLKKRRPERRDDDRRRRPPPRRPGGQAAPGAAEPDPGPATIPRQP